MGLLQEEELLVNRIATRFWAERAANGTDENENLKPPDFSYKIQIVFGGREEMNFEDETEGG